MARYKGPRVRISRRFGIAIFGSAKYLERRQYPPGVHGPRMRRKSSEYAQGLMEKQKMRYFYGLLEKQFRNLFEKANSSKGITGEVLLQLLESRLDNVVYRLGIAKTRDAARQFVTHKHIVVNGKVVNVPSYLVKPGDLIGVRERSKAMEEITTALHSRRSTRYEWLEWDNQEMAGKFLNVPERDEIPENIKEQLIVELYSK